MVNYGKDTVYYHGTHTITHAHTRIYNILSIYIIFYIIIYKIIFSEKRVLTQFLSENKTLVL